MFKLENFKLQILLYCFVVLSTCWITTLAEDLNGSTSAHQVFKSELNSASIADKKKILDGYRTFVNRSTIRLDVPNIKKMGELVADTDFMSKLPGDPTNFDMLSKIADAVKNACSTCTTPQYLTSLSEHLNNLEYFVKNFDGKTGFQDVFNGLKNNAFIMQDGMSHMLAKLKTYTPGEVLAFEGNILESLNDADNLNGICTACLFDIKLSNGTKIELKSYSSTTILGISSSPKFKNQFKAYLADANSMNDFEYIFNGKKIADLNIIKQNFKTLFQQNNYQIYVDINNLNPGLWNSLGIDDISDFTSMVDNLDPNLYKFINILN